MPFFHSLLDNDTYVYVLSTHFLNNNYMLCEHQHCYHKKIYNFNNGIGDLEYYYNIIYSVVIVSIYASRINIQRWKDVVNLIIFKYISRIRIRVQRLNKKISQNRSTTLKPIDLGKLWNSVLLLVVWYLSKIKVASYPRGIVRHWGGMLGILIATQPGNRVWLSDVRTPANRGFVGVNSSNTSIHFEHACYISSSCFENLNLIEIYVYLIDIPARRA